MKNTGDLHDTGSEFLEREIIRPDIMKLTNMRMIQSRNGPSLALKPGTELSLRNLNSNSPVQPSVQGLVNLAHATFANQRKNLITPEPLAHTDRHDCRSGYHESADPGGSDATSSHSCGDGLLLIRYGGVKCVRREVRAIRPAHGSVFIHRNSLKQVSIAKGLEHWAEKAR